MKTILKIKLAPTPQQKQYLLKTIEQFNAACSFISHIAFENKLTNKFKLQKIVYKQVRKHFSLSAQMTIRAIAKVCDSYKRDKSNLVSFRPHGAIVYDERIMSFKGIESVSLWTL